MRRLLNNKQLSMVINLLKLKDNIVILSHSLSCPDQMINYNYFEDLILFVATKIGNNFNIINRGIRFQLIHS